MVRPLRKRGLVGTASATPSLGLRPVAGVLSDGTVYYAPIGEVWAHDDRLCCHVCGHWFRSVVVHLHSHGWTREQYVQAFGLEWGVALEADQTRARRAAAFRPRRTFEPAVREGVAAGQAMARSGELTELAANAARGRPHPAQRRAKTLATLAQISPEAKTEGVRRRRSQELRDTAAAVGARFGFDSLDAFVIHRLAHGASLASTSREAGLHKDWLQRHLSDVAPHAAENLEALRLGAVDQRLSGRARSLGFDNLRVYLVYRHAIGHNTIHAIATEMGISQRSVEAAMRRHGVERTAHASKRNAALRREQDVARRLGIETLSSFVQDRRVQGWSWAKLAAGCDVPASWLRRRSAAWARTPTN